MKMCIRDSFSNVGSYVGNDMYHKYEEDIKLLKSLNFKSFRTSMPVSYTHLTVSQQEKFMEFVKQSNVYNTYYPMFTIMIGTGLRWHLRGNALRAAVFITHQHAFDNVPVRKFEQILFRAVGRNERFADLHGLVFEPFAKFRAQRFGKFGKIGNALALHQPAEDLRGAELPFAPFFHQNLQFGKGIIL